MKGINPLNLHIDTALQNYLYPQTESERSAMQASIEKDGILDPIKVVLIGDKYIILDGHNRQSVALKLGLNTMPVTVIPGISTLEDAKAWMQRFHEGKRSVSPDRAIAWALMSGQSVPSEYNKFAVDIGKARKLHEEGKLGDVLDGTLSIRIAYGRAFPTPRKPRTSPKYTPPEPETQPPAGPQNGPYTVPQGHELAGRSTLLKDGHEVAAWDKTRIKSGGGVVDPIPEEHLITKRSTYFGANGDVRGQHVTVKPDEVRREELMRAAWARHAALYAGLADAVPTPTERDADLITLYPLGDPHIGMLAWAPESGANFDTTIACRQLLSCVKQLVAQAPSSERAIVCNLGDFLHAQDDTRRTPGHGHLLDVDGRFAKVLDAGHAVLRGIIDAALTKHQHVTIRNLPGNHDPRVAAELAMWLSAVYEREPRVTVEAAYAAHQYDRFGSCLFGWHHGDGTPAAELPSLMATDRAGDWGETKERVWHVGHIHHKTKLTMKESAGCVVESHRTMAAPDAWHAKRYRAARSLDAITYHTTHGESSRVRVSLSRVQA